MNVPRSPAAMRIAFLETLLTCLGALLGCRVGAYQDPDPRSFPVKSQETSGCWSAARFEGATDGDLRATLWMTLACLAHRPPSKDLERSTALAIAWLTARQDEEGRVGFDVAPDWLLDHALATTCLLERLRVKGDPTLATRAGKALAALADNLELLQGKCSVEVVLWAGIALSAANHCSKEFATLHTKAITRLQSCVRPPDGDAVAVEGAAKLVLRCARDPGLPLSALQSVQWPEHAAATPTTELYLTMAFVFAAAHAGRPESEVKALRQVLADRYRAAVALVRMGGRDPLQGTVDPQGTFGKQFGRVATSAVIGLVNMTHGLDCPLSFWSEKK